MSREQYKGIHNVGRHISCIGDHIGRNFEPWEPPSKHRNWCYRKTFFSFKILIHNFHKQNNSFYHNSIRCKHRHRCYNYYGHRTTMLIIIYSRKQFVVRRFLYPGPRGFLLIISFFNWKFATRSADRSTESGEKESLWSRPLRISLSCWLST